MSRAMTLLVALALLTSLLAFPVSAADGPSATPPGQDPDHAPGTAAHDHGPADARRGMVFDGLQRGRPGTACEAGYELPMAATGPQRACTHGPDPAPDGVDVTQERPVAELQQDSATFAAEGSGQIQCIDDGRSGNRVQAMYVVASDRPDRFNEIAPLIPGWARNADAVFADSAAKTGGVRHIRWVTNADCSLSVIRVVLSPTGDDSITNTMNELRAQGYNLASRKYMMWTDSTRYCGIASIYTDARPTGNNNDGRYAQYSRVDSGCWGLSNPVEAHEIMHNLGGVQPTAPHGTSQWHCTDDYDRMCYSDGTGGTMTYGCASSQERLFDCGNDDYFHTSPPAGNWLATNWNTANSSFLTSSAGSTQPAPDPQPEPEPEPVDTTAPSAPTGVTATAGDARVEVRWTASPEADVASYRVHRDGVVVATVTGTSWTNTGLVNGRTYAYRISAVDTSGNQSALSTSVSATPQAPTPPPSGVQLQADGYKSKGKNAVSLSWSGATTSSVIVYRNGSQVMTTANDGSQVHTTSERGGGTFRYRLCETGGGACSPEVTVTIS